MECDWTEKKDVMATEREDAAVFLVVHKDAHQCTKIIGRKLTLQNIR